MKDQHLIHQYDYVNLFLPSLHRKYFKIKPIWETFKIFGDIKIYKIQHFVNVV